MAPPGTSGVSTRSETFNLIWITKQFTSNILSKEVKEAVKPILNELNKVKSELLQLKNLTNKQMFEVNRTDSEVIEHSINKTGKGPKTNQYNWYKGQKITESGNLNQIEMQRSNWGTSQNPHNSLFRN